MDQNMGSEIKHGMMSSNSETCSSDEDEDRGGKDGRCLGMRSYYECSFCKRGFTNAQALGGHMNIHRKHKLLAKPTNQHQHHASTSSYSPDNKHHHDHPSDQSFNIIINPYNNQHPAAAAADFGFHPTAAGRVSDDDDHHQLSNPSRRNFHWNNLAADEDNLNLRIGGTSTSDEINIGNTSSNNLGFAKIGQDDQDWRYENDVDLELRLGHYP